MARRTYVGVALLTIGVVLIANPFYLGHLMPYPTPGDGFRLTGLYHAQLGVLGLVAMLSGAFALQQSRPLTPRGAGLLAFAAVLGHVVVNQIVLRASRAILGREAFSAFGGALINPIEYPGGEGLFVEFVVASLFAVGVLARSEPSRERATVLAALGAVFAFMVVAGSARNGVFGVLLLAFSTDLLGIPASGLVLTVLPLVLGLSFDRLVDGGGGRDTPG